MDATDKRAFAVVATIVVAALTFFLAGVTSLGAIVGASTGGRMESGLPLGILLVGGSICTAIMIGADRARR